MLGQTHALSGAAAFLAAAFPLSHYVHHLTPLTAAIGTIVAAGAGLLPDLDHPSATPARAFGPISQAAAQFIHDVSGGHRHGTHSKWGLLACGVLAPASYLSSWTLAFVIWTCMGLGIRALWKKPKNRPNGKLDYGDIAGLIHALVAAYVAYRLTHSGIDLSVIPLAVTLGYGVHLFGDSLTESGIPWTYPNPKRYRLASIDTGKAVERLVVVPALYVGIAAVVFVTHGTWWPALLRTVAPG
jgi:membrane-bound metal-dependent hydrolase YbcI (DUF457 family)